MLVMHHGQNIRPAILVYPKDIFNYIITFNIVVYDPGIFQMGDLFFKREFIFAFSFFGLVGVSDVNDL